MFKIRIEQQSEEQRKRQEQIAENWSFRVRKIRRTIRGKITKVYPGRRYDVLVPGREYPYERVPTDKGCYLKVGQVVDVAFMEDNPGIPVILCRKSVSGPRVFQIPVFFNFFSAWYRVAARLFSYCSVPELDAEENPGVYPHGDETPEEERPAASIARSYNSTLYWAEGPRLHSRDDETGEEVETDLGGPVQTLTLTSSGATWCIVNKTSGGGGDCEAAYAAGYDTGSLDDFPADTGFSDCDEGNGYLQDERFNELESFPDIPPEYSADEECWLEGWEAGWRDAYDFGFEDLGGCDTP